MKKIIAIFLTISSMFSFFILFNSEKVKQRNEMEKAEQSLKYNYNIMIPTKVDSKNSEEILKNLEETLDKYNGSIYYKRLSKGEETQTVYTYINDNEYLSKFKLKSGQMLEKNNMDSTNFISSKESDDINQTGVISTFSKENTFEIHTLKDMVEKGFSFGGECYISFSNKTDIDKFIKDLNKSLDISGISIVDKPNVAVSIKNDEWIIFIFYFITMLLVLYDLLKSYKKVGIEKLLGFSERRIYLNRIVSLTKIFVIVSLVTTIVIVLYKFRDFNSYVISFLLKLLYTNIIQGIVFILICSIPFLYINKIKIANMLKNKKLTTEIMVFNFFVKIILLSALIIIVNQGVNNFDRIKNVFTESFKQWDEVKEYAGIPSLVNISNEEFSNDKYLKNQKELYKYFNEQGSLLANFNEYSPGTREMRIKETNYDYERDNVTVNPNYLDKYPIYDENGDRITISEDDTNYIILIPEKFKNNEKEILNLFDTWKDTRLVAISKDQPNKIIWTKSNQKLFSMEVDINPNDGNYVVDPIVHVLTNNNANLSNYDTILGISGLPFKIKVNDYNNPSESIMPILKEFGYDKNVNKITSINEQVASESKSINEMIKFLAVSISIVLVCIIVVVLQNIYNYFDKYNKKIAIKKLSGYTMFDKYKNYFFVVLLSWIIVFVIHLLMNKVSLKITFYAVIIGVIVELLISMLILIFIDKKKVGNIIKGGI